MLVFGWNLPFLKLKGCTIFTGRMHPQLVRSSVNCYNTNIFFFSKITVKLLIYMFAKKIYPIVNTNAIWSSGFVFKGLITRKLNLSNGRKLVVTVSEIWSLTTYIDFIVLVFWYNKICWFYEMFLPYIMLESYPEAKIVLDFFRSFNFATKPLKNMQNMSSWC